MKRISIPMMGRSVLASLLLSACGGGGSETVTSSTTAPDTAFPAQVALVSPTNTSSTASVASVGSDLSIAAQKEPDDIGDYKKTADDIVDLLSDHSKKSAFVSSFSVASLVKPHAGYAPCYGPTMYYQNHMDGVLPNSGQLPSGDLGIWRDTVSNPADASPNLTACAAAQLNRNVYAASHRVNAGLKLMALLRATSRASSGSALAAGSSVTLTTEMNALALANVTFTSATLARDITGDAWTYTIKADFIHPRTFTTQQIELTLQHTRASGGVSYPYNGLLTYKIGDTVTAGNCLSTPSAGTVVRVGTLKYTRTSATQMEVNHRTGQYCGDMTNLPAGLTKSDGQLDPAATYDSVSHKGWADDFNRFAGQYNPQDGAGNYIYAWQAGSGDSNARLLGINLNARQSSGSQTGEAYFGYGDTIQTTTGAIKGMICNWAGPGSLHTLQKYAQRQFLELNTTSGQWEVGVGGSDIRYAPTNSCQYTAANRVSTGNSFWYDRDLTGLTTGDPTAANLTVEGSSGATAFDLKDTMMGLTDYFTIEAMMAARGYTLPTNF